DKAHASVPRPPSAPPPRTVAPVSIQKESCRTLSRAELRRLRYDDVDSCAHHSSHPASASVRQPFRHSSSSCNGWENGVRRENANRAEPFLPHRVSRLGIPRWQSSGKNGG